jgi:hypothetical protein
MDTLRACCSWENVQPEHKCGPHAHTTSTARLVQVKKARAVAQSFGHWHTQVEQEFAPWFVVAYCMLGCCTHASAVISITAVP